MQKSQKHIAKQTLFFGLLFLFGSVHSAETDKPTISMRAEPPYFSPNADKLQDQVFFYLVMPTRGGVTRWRMDIEQLKGKRVARLSGSGFPALVKWDGMDKNQAVVKDGEYVATLKVWGKNTLIVQEKFFVDTVKPEASLFLSSVEIDKSFLDDKKLAMTPSVRDASPVERWQIQIIDKGGRDVQLFTSTVPVHEVQWSATDRATGVLVPQGSYQCAFQAWDVAGNESAPFFAEIKVTVPPRDMLERVIKGIQINETPMGLIVQLDSGDLFMMKKKTQVFSLKAPDLLREVAILINAYPDVPVILEGYSNASKNYQKDRQKASFYAWSVYSYLVKNGNVNASRLTVRSRGRSAMFDRRGVNVPVLKNGVEVILEGDRKW